MSKFKMLAVLGLITATPLAFAGTNHCVRSGTPQHVKINCTGTLTNKQAWKLAHGLFALEKNAFKPMHPNNNWKPGCWTGIGGHQHCRKI